jgi:hypothetical protein
LKIKLQFNNFRMELFLIVEPLSKLRIVPMKWGSVDKFSFITLNKSFQSLFSEIYVKFMYKIILFK